MSINIESHSKKEGLPSLVQSFGDNVKPWINIIDQLRSKGVDEHVSLPTIAVMGDQSSGKSSVLEAVTGICLPRGNDIVTRCPLELKMESYAGPWTARLSYSYPPNYDDVEKHLDDPEQVAEAILEAQRMIAGEKDDVCSDLISLHVKASDAPDLTVIDLPGIVHTRKKTQNKNIIQCINKLLETYMEKEETIILAVLPANVDLATCAVLEMANKYDPQAQRTIAVITKTDAVYDNSSKEKLCDTVQDGNLHNINQYFFVRNRTNEELLQNVPLSVAIKNEAEFFENDYIYRSLPKHVLGIPNLTTALTARLVDAIKERFPNIENEVNKQLIKTMNELQTLPPSTPDNDVGRAIFYSSAANQFISKLQIALSQGQIPCYWHSIEPDMMRKFDSLDLNDDKRLENYLTQEPLSNPTIYSRWRNIYEEYSKDLQSQSQQFLSNQKDRHHETLRNMRGMELPTFINYDLFRTLVKLLLERYKPIAENCYLRMEKNLKALLFCFVKEHLRSYAILQKHVLSVASETLRQVGKTTKEKLNFLFLCEQTVYTNDGRFMDAYDKLMKNHVQGFFASGSGNGFGNLSQTQVDLERVLLDNLTSYVDIAVFRLSDTVPALIMASLHNLFHQRLAEELLSSERTQQACLYLSKPDPNKRQRENLMKKMESLNQGVELLRNFAEKNI